jgi:hypothetical protein
MGRRSLGNTARQAKYIYRNIKARYLNHFYRGKTITITHSDSVFIALDIQHGKRMRRTTLSPVACPSVQHSSTLSHKR